MTIDSNATDLLDAAFSMSSGCKLDSCDSDVTSGSGVFCWRLQGGHVFFRTNSICSYFEANKQVGGPVSPTVKYFQYSDVIFLFQMPKLLANFSSSPIDFIHPSAVVDKKAQVCISTIIHIRVYSRHYFLCSLMLVFQTGGDSLVGFESEVAEKCTLKRSSIGKHCNIDAKVKLANSLLMDNVKVGEG